MGAAIMGLWMRGGATRTEGGSGDESNARLKCLIAEGEGAEGV